MTEHLSRIDRLAEANMRNWMLGEQVQQRLQKQEKTGRIGPYLAISRETGTDGSEIARLVGEQLGWEVLDKQILDRMAEKYGADRALLDFVDEKTVTWLNDFFTSMMISSDVDQSSYIHRLGKMLILAAHKGEVVVVGRGAQFILPRDQGISVRITAPHAFRVDQVARQQGISHEEAQRHVEQSDRERAKFIKTFFHHQDKELDVYDLVINVAKISKKDVVDLISSTVTRWMKESGHESQ